MKSGKVFLAQEKPNVLFLFAEVRRADTIAVHGNRHIKSVYQELHVYSRGEAAAKYPAF